MTNIRVRFILPEVFEVEYALSAVPRRNDLIRADGSDSHFPQGTYRVEDVQWDVTFRSHGVICYLVRN